MMANARPTLYYDILLKTPEGEQFVVRGWEIAGDYYRAQCSVTELPASLRKPYAELVAQGQSLKSFGYVTIDVPKKDAIEVKPVASELMWQAVKTPFTGLTHEEAIVEAYRSGDLRATLIAVLDAFTE
jgi:hypothetical protein